MTPNSRGHYPIEALGVELGIWEGEDRNQEWPSMGWWDAEGNFLSIGEERASPQAEQLRALGVEPEA